jgi:hypothetical protein
MQGESRVERPPLDLRREFAGSRLEVQVLVRVYELVVPVVRRQAAATWMSAGESLAAVCPTGSLCVVQGA